MLGQNDEYQHREFQTIRKIEFANIFTVRYCIVVHICNCFKRQNEGTFRLKIHAFDKMLYNITIPLAHFHLNDY